MGCFYSRKSVMGDHLIPSQLSIDETVALLANSDTWPGVVPGFEKSKIQDKKDDYFVMKVPNTKKQIECKDILREKDFYSYSIDA